MRYTLYYIFLGSQRLIVYTFCVSAQTVACVFDGRAGVRVCEGGGGGREDIYSFNMPL